MQWMLWIVVGWFVIGSLTVVANVGKPRSPITAGQAAINVAVVAVLITLIVVGGIL